MVMGEGVPITAIRQALHPPVWPRSGLAAGSSGRQIQGKLMKAWGISGFDVAARSAWYRA